jgi:hypothetical protein
LLANKNQNKHLQYSFNKYSELENNDNFMEFHIIEVMKTSTKEQRLKREKYWIQQYVKNGIKIYNSNLEPTVESKIWSHNPKETKKKISASLKNNEKLKATQFKKGHEGLKGEKNPMFGKPGTWLGKYHSEKTKQKISKINSGKIHTEKSRKI